MKKILLITDAWKPQTNGVVTTLTNLEINLKKSGFDPIVISPNNFKTFRCPGYKDIDISLNVWQISKHIDENNPDYIHIATEGPVGLAAKMYCDINKIKYSTSYHTNFPEYLNNFFNIPRQLTYAFLKYFHKNSVSVMVATDSIEKELSSRGFKNIKKWSRGVDFNHFKPIVKKIQSEKKTILCVSRVSKEKNLEEFFNLDINANKIMVGDGPMLNEYINKYPDVDFKGFLYGEELNKAYCSADAFVFPSLTDTFGLVVIESISCGTPVAAFDAPGPRDIIETGINGFFGGDLCANVIKCFSLDRSKVCESSQKWSWENSTNMFIENILPMIEKEAA